MTTRTELQNSAMHLYFRMLADALNDAGLEMKAVLAAKEVDVPWDERRIKEVLWRPIQEAMTNKESTTELTTGEPSQIYDVLNRHLGEKFGIHVPWPHNPEKP